MNTNTNSRDTRAPSSRRSVAADAAGVPTSQAAAEIADQWRTVADCCEMAREAALDAIEEAESGVDGSYDVDAWKRYAAGMLNALDSALVFARKRQLAHELST